MTKTSKFVQTVGDLTSGEHWAIITEATMFIPGDERSRTHPGHGYPESIEHYITYESFTDEVAFRKELQQRMSLAFSGSKVKGIHVTSCFSAKTVIELQEQR